MSNSKKRIALQRPGAIGDVIMTLNLVPELKNKYPDYFIDYFCNPYIGQGLRYLMEYAGIDKILPHTSIDEKKNDYEQIINLIGYPFKEGYPDKPMQKHLIEYFAAEMGLEINNIPSLSLPLPERPAGTPRAYATIQTKTGWSNYKEWSLERWASIVKESEFPVIQIGEAKSEKIPGAIHDYIGKDLMTAISLIANANLHIGLDSFGNHLTNFKWLSRGELKQTPGIILWGSSQWSAAGYEHNSNICVNLSCQPCFRQDPKLIKNDNRGACNNPPGQTYDTPKHECMNQITSDMVMQEIRKKWEDNPSKKDTKTTICLTMIVKNESHIIHELLESIYEYLDYWVIVDTGSTDNTKDIIKSFFEEHGIDGELHERPWKNFGHNRTESLFLADGKCDYMWVIDADDRLQGKIKPDNLTKDCYYLKYINNNSVFSRAQFFKSGRAWKYVGVVHEYPDTYLSFSRADLPGDYYIQARTLGARNHDPEKYIKDAMMLEEALKDDPNNSRHWFYLGRSYVAANDSQKAKQAFKKRTEMGGWSEEVFYAWYELGHCEIRLNSSEADIANAFLNAYNACPSRAESLHSLARYYRTKGKFELGYMMAKIASGIPLPGVNALFVDPSVYDYQILDELSVCAYYTSHTKEGYTVCKKLAGKASIPKVDKQRIIGNLELYKKHKKI